ncbi:MAG: peptidoglycan-associated lipoprotein Pal [Candidatus Eisenbacteria bacterium]|nr:peptidoglycan-associated lipoprotein Pal [Candidatus Eisenbacteria bacterium]
MSPTLLRTTVIAAALMALFAVGCAKKGVTPPAAPPAAPTSPTTPGTPGTTDPGTTTPGTGGTTSTAKASDLRIVYFDLDSYAIVGAAQADLDANARILRENTALRVTIEGHCDERGTVEYNLALGQKRADSVRDYLLAAGVPAGQLATLSKGKEFPAAEGSDETAWAKNRRAEFK